jgi:pimeloyl-ACP methyl ester carboxylesterase
MLTHKTFPGSAVPSNYIEGPPGGPALLLLHGLTQRWQVFLPLMAQLTQTHHVFAPDFRGHGGSGHLKDGYRGEEYSNDVIEFIERTIDKPVTIFGHSLGGLVGVYIAGCRPETVKALIVGDSRMFLHNFNRTMYVEMFEKTLVLLEKNRDFDFLRRELPEMVLHSANGPVAMKSFPKFDEPYLAAWARSLSQLDPDTLRMTLDGRAAENWRPQEFLSKVKCPTLLMQGDPKMGALMSDDDVAQARELMRDTMHVRVEGVGHSLHISDPAPVLRALGSFLLALE